MGLMQVMPSTYDELRDRYGLGDDPYDPHDNVLAGTAYLREMYDIYGFPGFLAAYNAGPGRLDDYLTRNKALPDETRNYVRKIAPNIVGIEPNRASAAGQYAMNRLPMDIPPGPRYPRRPVAPVALAENRYTRPGPDRSVQATPLAELPLPPAPPPVQVASNRPTRGGFRLISPAMAETLPAQPAPNGSWAIQVGAFANEGQARAAAETARGHAEDLLGRARTTVGTVRAASATLYRARLTGLSRETALQACQRLGHHGACIVLSPEAQG
jgi:cell division protein FtsN